MDSIIKKIFSGKEDEECHQQFIRFGRGKYSGRFLLSFAKGEKVKIRASFEMANDFVNMAQSLGDLKFSGKILSKEKLRFGSPKKKAGSLVYEVEDINLEDYEGAYFYLLDATSDKILLKIKKSLPKPGKDAGKADDKFCSLDIDKSLWPKAKEFFFWDVDENAKKAKISHDVIVEEIVYPKGETDAAKIRELAKRKGKLIRKIVADGKESSEEKQITL